MRRIINSTYISLDGVIENPQDWPSLDGSDDAGTAVQTELLLGCDALLLGKDTYQSFASVWQGQSGAPFTDQMNAITKYVVSSTLRDPDWANSTVVTGDVAEQVARLKGEPGKDIVSFGVGRLAGTLMEHGLLDEIRLWVHPFFVGTATQDGLLFGHVPASRLELVNTQTLASGIVILSYTVQRPESAG